MSLIGSVGLSPEQEQNYLRRQRERMLPSAHLALVTGILILAALGAWEQWRTPGLDLTALGMRAALAVAWLLALFALASAWGRERMDVLLLVLHGVTATLSALILAVIPDGFQEGITGLLLPALVIGVLAPNLQFTVAYCLIYLVIGNVVLISSGAEPALFAHANAFLVPALLAFLYVGFHVQNARRRAFADEAALAAERDELATTDPLTATHNRHHFLRMAAVEIERSRRHGHPLSLLLVDVDGFKRINEEAGTAAGDAVLHGVGRVLLDGLRQTDILGRTGDDEFGALLTDTPQEAASPVAERLRAAVERLPVEVDGESFRATVSIGCVQLLAGEIEVSAMLQRADKALYLDGGAANRVVNR